MSNAPFSPEPESSRWLLLQLVDGAFPSGGFAHSGGLEAAVRLGGLAAARPFLEQVAVQAAYGSLPFVRAAARAPGEIGALDDLCHASLSSPVANRASRAQGRALSSSAGRVFEHDGVRALAAYGRSGHAHHAPVFGALYGALGLDARAAEVAFLHGVVRGSLSAAVRLGLLGPLEAQRTHAEVAPHLEAVLEASADLLPEEAAQTAPLIELFGSLHDALDARLFQS